MLAYLVRTNAHSHITRHGVAFTHHEPCDTAKFFSRYPVARVFRHANDSENHHDVFVRKQVSRVMPAEYFGALVLD